MREHVIAGAIVSCWKQDVENYGPRWIKGFGHAYAIAGHMAMAGLGTWAKRRHYRGGIEYVIEAGDDGYDQLAQLLSYAPRSRGVADMYQWAADSAEPKTPACTFHAPDLLAWEWGKYWTESVLSARASDASIVDEHRSKPTGCVHVHAPGWGHLPPGGSRAATADSRM